MSNPHDPYWRFLKVFETCVRRTVILRTESWHKYIFWASTFSDVNVSGPSLRFWMSSSATGHYRCDIFINTDFPSYTLTHFHISPGWLIRKKSQEIGSGKGCDLLAVFRKKQSGGMGQLQPYNHYANKYTQIGFTGLWSPAYVGCRRLWCTT